MVTSGIEGVEFMCINTDAQALKHSKVKTSLQIGCNITKGLGAGADPEVGRQAAMEDRDRIIEMIEGCDMLFITAGMGGGTGTGASPLRPNIACSRSDCSVLVGRPVDGPPRCELTMTSGSSVMIASPIASPLSAMPGPDEEVTPSWPA